MCYNVCWAILDQYSEEFLFFFISYMNTLNWLQTQSIGAVNCVIRRPTDGKLIGYNTDYVGSISAIEDGLRGSCHI